MANSVKLGSFVEHLVCGDVQRFRNMAFAPILLDDPALEHPGHYVLITHAIRDGTVMVEETGSVSTLFVTNTSDLPVLVPAGVYLQGGGQDRMVAASVVIAAKTKGPLNVHCVERMRWDPVRGRRFTSPQFGSMSASSVFEQAEPSSERQAASWDTVEMYRSSTQSISASQRLGDVVEQHVDDIKEYEDPFKLFLEVGQMVGAFFMVYEPKGEKTRWLADVFGQNQLALDMYEPLLESAALAALACDWQKEDDDIPDGLIITPERFGTLCWNIEVSDLPTVSLPLNHGVLRSGKVQLGATVSVLEDEGHPVHIAIRHQG